MPERVLEQWEERRQAGSEPKLVLLDGRPLQGPDAHRGVGTYVRGLLQGLEEIGWGSRLALLVDAGLPVPKTGLPTYPLRKRYRGRLSNLEDALALRFALEQIRPALYHATSLSLPGRAPCPVVATLHDLIPWAYGGRALLGERIRYWAGKRLLRNADRVLAVSEASAADARRLAAVDARRLEVVPEGVGAAFHVAEGAGDRVRARYGLEPGYLLYVGALDARKDPRGLLAAWRAAEAAGAAAPLVLAGEPGAQAPANMGAAVRLGLVGEAELVDLYGAAGCLVFPSRYEGFGLPLLEAMACGCPAVAYANSSLPEVAGEAAELVADGDAEALGRAAAALLLEPRRRQAARRRGLQRARRYTWARTAEMTARVYADLVHD